MHIYIYIYIGGTNTAASYKKKLYNRGQCLLCWIYCMQQCFYCNAIIIKPTFPLVLELEFLFGNAQKKRSVKMLENMRLTKATIPKNMEQIESSDLCQFTSEFNLHSVQ